MTTTLGRNQYSIAGLLFITLGVGIFFSIAPYLYANSITTPPWSVFVLLVLLFSWCMIPLRTGPARAWWIGFLVFGSLYLAFALRAEPNELFSRAAVRVGQLVVVFGVLVASVLLVLGSGVMGGVLLRGIYRRVRLPCKNVWDESTT